MEISCALCGETTDGRVTLPNSQGYETYICSECNKVALNHYCGDSIGIKIIRLEASIDIGGAVYESTMAFFRDDKSKENLELIIKFENKSKYYEVFLYLDYMTGKATGHYERVFNRQKEKDNISGILLNDPFNRHATIIYGKHSWIEDGQVNSWLLVAKAINVNINGNIWADLAAKYPALNRTKVQFEEKPNGE